MEKAKDKREMLRINRASVLEVQLSDSSGLPGRCRPSLYPVPQRWGRVPVLKTGASGVNTEKVSIRTQLGGRRG